MIVLDTHAFIWVLQDEPRLGPKARDLVVKAPADGSFGVAAITLWEIATLVDKGRLGLTRDVGEWVETALALLSVRLLPIEPGIALDSVRLPGKFHADPADRLIIATARHWDAALLTADAAILGYGISGNVRVIDARY